jgi:hypothetical protein
MGLKYGYVTIFNKNFMWIKEIRHIENKPILTDFEVKRRLNFFYLSK